MLIYKRLKSQISLNILSKRWRVRSKREIIRSWYPEDVLSDEQVDEMYSRLLNYFLTLYYADKENQTTHSIEKEN